MNDLVSIIMPNYNASKYIDASIHSVLNQTYKNFELIIVDDVSTDNSVELIKKYEDKRIKLFINEKNSGAAISRNRALREAKGKWIAFLDSDDIWDCNKLEKQINFMNANDYKMSFTDYRICNNGIWENVVRTAPNKITYRKIINYCYFFTSTVMYDANYVGLIQITDLKKNNDYGMWLHAVRKTNAYRLSENLAFYIKHDSSISAGSKFKLIKHHYILFRQELGKNRLSAFCLTINNLFYGVLKKVFYKKNIKKY